MDRLNTDNIPFEKHQMENEVNNPSQDEQVWQPEYEKDVNQLAGAFRT